MIESMLELARLEGGRTALHPQPLDLAAVVREVADMMEPQARLFVRFRQLSAGSTKAYEGTGIGLAIVKQIVEAQGGQVGVRSVFGKGSAFWAELPAPAGAGPAQPLPR